jgi:hypothetical protein
MSANNEKSRCDYNEYRRPQYFHGMLLDDKDFLDEQNYHAGKRRLLNRMLHGSGVVCGLILTKQGDEAIAVSAGLALDCCGNEIWVNKSLQLPLTKLIDAAKNSVAKNPCAEPAPGQNLKCYLGIRYDEKGTNPVAVYLPGAGCDERTCKNSRVKEGYCFELVASCPKKQEPLAECGQPSPCPECEHCDKPCYVILGQIEYNEQGKIVNLYPEECREYVITGRLLQQLILSTSARETRLQGSAMQPVQPAQGTEIRQPTTVELLCTILRSHTEYIALAKEVQDQKEAIGKLQNSIRPQPAEASAESAAPPNDHPAEA